MTYFEDLSAYRYDRSASGRLVEKNIGWLGLGHEFARLKPSEVVLDQLWKLCAVSVSPSRGTHQCEFCDRGDGRWPGQHNDQSCALCMTASPPVNDFFDRALPAVAGAMSRAPFFGVHLDP